MAQTVEIPVPQVQDRAGGGGVLSLVHFPFFFPALVAQLGPDKCGLPLKQAPLRR